MKNTLTKVQSALGRDGLLLLTDTKLPSLTTIVSGGPVRGSWWSHAQGSEMFHLSNRLADANDTLAIKLINSKLTFVERRHWNALYVIGKSQSDWQLAGRTPPELALLDLLKREAEIRADQRPLGLRPAEAGKIIDRLSKLLLLHSESIHTDGGKHVRAAWSWDKTFAAKKYRPKKMGYPQAIAGLDKLAARWSSAHHSVVKLPWPKGPAS